MELKNLEQIHIGKGLQSTPIVNKGSGLSSNLVINKIGENVKKENNLQKD